MIISPLLADAGPIETLNTTLETAGFSPAHLIGQIIAFLLVAGALNAFAYKPIRNLLEQRRKAIADGVASVEKIKRELAEAETTRRKIVQQASEQADKIVAEAEKSAIARGELRIQEATRQAEEILRKAQLAAVLERDRLLAELKRQIGTLVIQTTSRVSGRVLTAEDQIRLNTETTRELRSLDN